MKDKENIPFPTGATVPFPYGTPYPQQIDLMDTILTSLRSTSSRTRTINGSNDTTTTSCCPIFMLESPTGTGKSLSLACAALAWLKHVEFEDLLHNKVVDNKGITTTTTNVISPKSVMIEPKLISSSSSELDWIDDWIPPAERERNQNNENVRLKAIASREQLEKELNQIRSKLFRNDNEPTQTQTQKNDRMRQTIRRQNLVQKAVVAAKCLETKNGTALGRHTKRSKPGSASILALNDPCLVDYNSDDNIDQTISSSHDCMDLNLTETKMYQSRDNNNTNQSPRGPIHLLNGSFLDGSIVMNQNCSSKSQHYYHHNKPQRFFPLSSFVSTAVANVQPGSGVRKIIYAARTHSQLSQFVGELRRTTWGNSIRVVSLGSRKALCGNHNINKKSDHYVNETCLDMQKGKGTTITTTDSNSNNKRASSISSTCGKGGCSLLSSREAVATLALHCLSHPTDIEEAAKLGDVTQTCSYYASRAAVQAAEVVVLPYSMLLSQQTRSAIGLSLKESFVIIDEAHNLPEALRGLHSCRLTLPTIQTALRQLKNYIQKYANRLAGRNIQYLGQIKTLLIAFEKYLRTTPPPPDDDDDSTIRKNNKTMMSITEFLLDRKIDNINLFKVLRFLEHSRLSQKLLGFTNSNNDDDNNNNNLASAIVRNSNDDDEEEESKHISAMSIFQSFLEKISLNSNAGKLVIDWPSCGSVGTDNGNNPTRSSPLFPGLRYVLLNPASFFHNVIHEARALALVGGTLKPFAHVAVELLGSNSCQQVVTKALKADVAMEILPSKVSYRSFSPVFTAFTCDHVVPASNVLLQRVAMGSNGYKLDFRHPQRYTNEVCDELGETLIEICQIVPCGVVVFIPSYRYETFIVQRWKKTGLWNRIQTIKKIYREPKSSQLVETTLVSYGRDVVVNGGALLLSVMGGKMSEGINFSDDMARCVVIVGLPYPDVTDPVLIEKMKLLDQTATNTSNTITNPNTRTTTNTNTTTTTLLRGRDYYHNLCLRTVNQSIGRAIRHANDYASILLLDQRYTTDQRIYDGLPTWLKRKQQQQQGQGEGERTSHTIQQLPISRKFRKEELLNFFLHHNEKNKRTIINE